MLLFYTVFKYVGSTRSRKNQYLKLKGSRSQQNKIASNLLRLKFKAAIVLRTIRPRFLHHGQCRGAPFYDRNEELFQRIAKTSRQLI